MTKRLQQIGRDFANLFKGKKGDLIYGLREQRVLYMDHYAEVKKKTIVNESWWSIDQYNNTYGLQVLINRGILDGIVNDDRRNVTVKPSMNRVIHSSFLQKMLSTPRRNPYRILERFEHDGDAMIMYEGTVYDEGEPVMTKQLKAKSDRSIRNACKFGLEYVASVHSEHGSCVHFILDGLDMEKVINKTKVVLMKDEEVSRVFVPITYSELRNVYRKWSSSEFNETIYFYRDYKHVKAPWEENPSAWRRYGVSRLSKYHTLVENMLAEEKYFPYRMEVQELLAAVNLVERTGDLNSAAETLKTVIDILKDLEQGKIQPTPINKIKNLSGQKIKVHLKNALDLYNKKRFTRKSRASKDAYGILRLLVSRGNSEHILTALNRYLEILPSSISAGTIVLSGPISRTGRLRRIIEPAYIHSRFNIVNGTFDI